MKKLTFNAPINSPNQSCRVFKGNTQITDRPYNLVSQPFVYESEDINGTYTIRCIVDGEICVYTRIVENESISTVYEIFTLKSQDDTDISFVDTLLNTETLTFYLKSVRTSGNEIFPHTVNLTIIDGSTFGVLDTTTINFTGNAPEYIPVTFTPNAGQTGDVTILVSESNDKVILDTASFTFTLVNEVVSNDGEYVLTFLDEDGNNINQLDLDENTINTVSLNSINTLNNNATQNFSIGVEFYQDRIGDDPGYIRSDIDGNVLNFSGNDNETKTFNIESFDITTSVNCYIRFINLTPNINVTLPDPISINITNIKEPYTDYGVNIFFNSISLSTSEIEPTNLNTAFNYVNDEGTGNFDVILQKIKTNNNNTYPISIKFTNASVREVHPSMTKIDNNTISINDDSPENMGLTLAGLRPGRASQPIIMEVLESGYKGSNRQSAITYYVRTPNIANYLIDFSYGNSSTNLTPAMDTNINLPIDNGDFYFQVNRIKGDGIGYNADIHIYVETNATGVYRKEIFNKTYRLRTDSDTITDIINDIPLSPFRPNRPLFDFLFNISIIPLNGSEVYRKTYLITNTTRNEFDEDIFYVTRFENKICDGTAVTSSVSMRNSDKFLDPSANNLDIDTSNYFNISMQTSNSTIIFLGKTINETGKTYYRRFIRNESTQTYYLGSSELFRCHEHYDYNVAFSGFRIKYTFDNGSGAVERVYPSNNNFYITGNEKYASTNLNWPYLPFKDGTISNIRVVPFFVINTNRTDEDLSHIDIPIRVQRSATNLTGDPVPSSDMNSIEVIGTTIPLSQESGVLVGKEYEGMEIRNFDPDLIYKFTFSVDNTLDSNINMFYGDNLEIPTPTTIFYVRSTRL